MCKQNRYLSIGICFVTKLWIGKRLDECWSIVFIFTVSAAALIPNLSGIISLVGAFSSSALALIFPPIIDIMTFWPDQLGKHNWKLYKDLLIILFGITGFVFGTYTSVENLFLHD